MNDNIISDIDKILRNIQKVSKEEYFKYKFDNNAILSFCVDEHYFIIEETNDIILFKEIVYNMWQDLPLEILNKIYYGFFFSKFTQYLKKIIVGEVENNKNSLCCFFKQFNTIDIKTFIMITKLYGFSLKESNMSISLGNYTICDFSYILNNYDIQHHFSKVINTSEDKISLIDNFFIIHNDIKAIDKKKAEEIFFDKIEKFINVALFCCGYCREDNCKITYQNANIFVDYVMKEKDTSEQFVSFQNASLLNPLYRFDDKFFDENKYRAFFEYIDKEDKELTEIERKLKVAIDWFGLSIRNNDLQQRYTFLSIALESLLSNKTNGLMDASITYRLREFSAYLAYDELEKRKEVFNRIKNLYDIRSQISHSGIAKKIKYKDYLEFTNIVSRVIKKVYKLTTEGIKTNAQLNEYINKEKGLA